MPAAAKHVLPHHVRSIFFCISSLHISPRSSTAQNARCCSVSLPSVSAHTLLEHSDASPVFSANKTTCTPPKTGARPSKGAPALRRKPNAAHQIAIAPQVQRAGLASPTCSRPACQRDRKYRVPPSHRCPTTRATRRRRVHGTTQSWRTGARIGLSRE